MKPKDYITEFKLDTQTPDIDGAMNQMRSDFMANVEFLELGSGLNITKFDNAVKQIKDKFDGVARRSTCAHMLSWDIFENRVCNAVRKVRFAEYYAAKRRTEERLRRNRERWQREQQADYTRMFNALFFGAIIRAAEDKITQAKVALGIDASAQLTEDVIKSSFRDKVKGVHSDKSSTASVEDFQKVMEARDLLLSSM